LNQTKRIVNLYLLRLTPIPHKSGEDTTSIKVVTAQAKVAIVSRGSGKGEPINTEVPTRYRPIPATVSE
jgi:hypothetical protein